MDTPKNYWASADDTVFETGHYVESWELERVTELPTGVTELLRREALRGNKVRSVAKGYVELAQPLAEQVWNLPEGLVFWCPLQEKSIGHYDGDEDGAVVCMITGTRVYPTGYELQGHDSKLPTSGAA